jgi:hypothetical protein
VSAVMLAMPRAVPIGVRTYTGLAPGHHTPSVLDDHQPLFRM